MGRRQEGRPWPTRPWEESSGRCAAQTGDVDGHGSRGGGEGTDLPVPTVGRHGRAAELGIQMGASQRQEEQPWAQRHTDRGRELPRETGSPAGAAGHMRASCREEQGSAVDRWRGLRACRRPAFYLEHLTTAGKSSNRDLHCPELHPNTDDPGSDVPYCWGIWVTTTVGCGKTHDCLERSP